MNTKLLIVALLIILVVGGGLFIFKSNKFKTNLQNQIQNQAVSPTPQVSPTMEASESAKKTVTITLTSSGFSPATITIDKGTTVVWKNESGQTATVNSDPHPIHTDFPPLNLGEFKNGESLSLLFTASGTHGYHNHLNPSDKGTIVVK